MKRNILNICIPVSMLLMVTSCQNGNNNSDAYGNFEATEIIVSAQGNGQLKAFNVDEGIHLNQGQIVGYVDTLQLYYKKEQLRAQRKTIASQTGNLVAQMDVLNAQLSAQQKEEKRYSDLVTAKAAPQKALDDIQDQIKVIKAQLKTLETQHAPVISQVEGIDHQIEQVNDQISNSLITNPVKGTVLEKYAEPGEVAAFGKPLYKIADLDTMDLRVYVSGQQLPSINAGLHVKAMIDNSSGGLDTLPGRISWIASDAEFTPKTVQTRKERVNLVYAVKVRVPNPGNLKIGMPGEIYIAEKKAKSAN